MIPTVRDSQPTSVELIFAVDCERGHNVSVAAKHAVPLCCFGFLTCIESPGG